MGEQRPPHAWKRIKKWTGKAVHQEIQKSEWRRLHITGTSACAALRGELQRIKQLSVGRMAEAQRLDHCDRHGQARRQAA